MSRPDRAGQARTMREALEETGLAAADIGYINAHGTATAVGDVVEAEAINGVEFAVALLALEEGVVAPTAFLEQPDPRDPAAPCAPSRRAHRAAPRRHVQFVRLRRLECGADRRAGPQAFARKSACSAVNSTGLVRW
jgi:3-oxoacyl-(acyl-carrier-protein) synthase